MGSGQVPKVLTKEPNRRAKDAHESAPEGVVKQLSIGGRPGLGLDTGALKRARLEALRVRATKGKEQ